jgi:hypothetical protein
MRFHDVSSGFMGKRMGEKYEIYVLMGFNRF